MRRPSISKELRKGSADLLILSLIEERPRHGYEIARLIDERSHGALTYHVASLYPTLYRLEDRGLIEGRWVERAGQRRRRHYRLLPKGRRVLATEAQAVAGLEGRLDEAFARACALLLACEGRIVVTGMGKSGHVGSKIAATLASTGSPAFFVHPAEAIHGDLGMITAKDVVLALSNSGETSELLTILPVIKRLGVPMIALTGNEASTLSRYAAVTLDVSVPEEACPLNLAPTASTTAALAMGDALAIAVLEARGFTEEDFARSHPGGSLGRRLLLHVEDVMRKGDELPRVGPETLLSEGLLEMSRKGLGMTTVVDDDDHVLGVFTDGDLRRALDRQVDIHRTHMREVMTAGGKVADQSVELFPALRNVSGLIQTPGVNMRDFARCFQSCFQVRQAVFRKSGCGQAQSPSVRRRAPRRLIGRQIDTVISGCSNPWRLACR